MCPYTMTCNPHQMAMWASRYLQCFCTYLKSCKVLFCEMCLQALMNYFDRVGAHNATERGVRKAYHNEFMSQACPYLLKKFQKYKANHLLNIPHCMGY